MLYRQQRVGKGGRVFTLYKWETMRDGIVTRPFLRRSGLDELPQVVNILKGDMSLFGPRPEVLAPETMLASLLGEAWTQRRRVKPGLLSLAATEGRIRTAQRYTLPAKAEQAALDAQQIDGGFRMKLRIMWALPRTLLKGQAA